MNAIKLISSTPITAAQKSSINAARSRFAELGTILHRTAKDRWEIDNTRGFLHLEADRLGEELAADPSLARAEAFHAALVRNRDAAVSAECIYNAIEVSLTRLSQSLGPVVAEIIGEASKTLAAEASTQRKAVEKSASGPLSTGREVQDFEARIAAISADLEGHLRQAQGDPLQWLERHGIAVE